MSKSKYQEQAVLNALRKKRDVTIVGTEIRVLKNEAKAKKHDLGNKSWAMIDYLCNFCGYRQIFVLAN